MSWPKRHLRRCGLFWQIHGAINMCKQVANNDYWPRFVNAYPTSTSMLGVKCFTDHEISEFAVIDKKLKDLYANRFIAYREMIKQEHLNEHN